MEQIEPDNPKKFAICAVAKLFGFGSHFPGRVPRAQYVPHHSFRKTLVMDRQKYRGLERVNVLVVLAFLAVVDSPRLVLNGGEPRLD